MNLKDKFLPSFVPQRSRFRKLESKAFLRDEYIPSLIVKHEEIAGAAILEIGSGKGETALQFASLNPDFLYIAGEVFLDGLIQTAGKVHEAGLTNVRFFTEDARNLLEKISGKLDKIFLFFPDPWPKKRHHKRRILTVEFLTLVRKALKENGELFVATDHPSYKLHILELASVQKIFKFEEMGQPEWWKVTKYQTKAINEGRSSNFFRFF